MATVTRPAPRRSAPDGGQVRRARSSRATRRRRARGRTCPCARRGPRGWTSGRRSSAVEQPEVGPLEGVDDVVRDPDVRDREVARQVARRRQHERELRRAERDGQRRLDGRTDHLVGVGRQAARQVDRDHRHRRRVDVVHDRLDEAGQRRLQAGAEQGVDDEVVTDDLGGVQFPVLLAGDLDDRQSHARRGSRDSSGRRRARRPARPTRKTETSTSRCRSVRATTKPSPPLLPRPQSTATRRSARSSKAASITATTWRPAFSMRTSDGMPDVLDRPAVGLTHLVRVEDPHRPASSSPVRGFVNRPRVRAAPAGSPTGPRPAVVAGACDRADASSTLHGAAGRRRRPGNPRGCSHPTSSPCSQTQPPGCPSASASSAAWARWPASTCSS